MSDDRQPTFDELRAKVALQGSPARTNAARRYAGTPGKGPEGMKCRDCGWMTYTGRAKPASHPKCGKTNYTSGDATTIHARSPSCEHFTEERQVPLKYRPLSGENRVRQFNEPKTVAPTP